MVADHSFEKYDIKNWYIFKISSHMPRFGHLIYDIACDKMWSVMIRRQRIINRTIQFNKGVETARPNSTFKNAKKYSSGPSDLEEEVRACDEIQGCSIKRQRT